MKKYMLKRILFSIFSLLVVVLVVMLLVYNLTDRSAIFQDDGTWNKKNNNDRAMYEYTMYQKYGYLNFTTYGSFLQQKYMATDGENYSNNPQYKADVNVLKDAHSDAKDAEVASKEALDQLYALDNASVQEFIAQAGSGDEVVFLQAVTKQNGSVKKGGNPQLLIVHERSVFLRLWDYLRGLFSIETTHDVADPALDEIDPATGKDSRYVRFEKDPYSGMFAIVGSGTTHKYLLYFDGRFPWIHQNWLHLNLGTSYTTYRGSEITDVMNVSTGEQVKVDTYYPKDLQDENGNWISFKEADPAKLVNTAINFHTLRYNPGAIGAQELEQYPDRYTVPSLHLGGLSKIENSFVMGIIATLLAYFLGLPLGILMALRKDRLGDKLGNAYIIFIMAVPSLAYIYMLAAFGTKTFDLPYKFAMANPKILGYILPTISLALPQIGSLMKWMRRYMIDQMNSDYVKFARSQGLSEREIFSTHISRNALIPLVHGIPASILGCLTGAIITERVYAVEGVGNLLTTAISKHDNAVIIACTVFYTTLSIVSLILGDLLLAKYDPRISLNADKGGGR